MFCSLLKCDYAPINGIPTPPPPGLGGEIVGIIARTEYHVKNPSPGALPDVNIPIYRQELIGDLT